MNFPKHRSVLVATAMLGLLGATPGAAGAQAPALDDINGMTVSTPRGNSAWAGDDMVGTIAELQKLGVNWIAIHPYGRIGADGTVSWSRRDTGAPARPPDWILRPIEEAHRRGMKIMIKPHLAAWRDFAWRGAIRFDSAAEWRRFFDSYKAWIVRVAEFSAGADAFVVGTELGGTAHHEGEWRDIIAAVRRVYTGPLTYAANWDAYERVGFWDAVDAVGIQAYFPLLAAPPADGSMPNQEQLNDGWSRVMARLSAFSAATGKPIVFTEAGYNNAPSAPYQPWDYSTSGGAEELQARCMAAALRAIDAEPAVLGAFLWKWFPGDRLPRDFAMAAPRMRRLIRDHWAVDGR